MAKKWIRRWNRTLYKTQIPGVWEVKGGGYLLRATKTLESGRVKEVQRVVSAETPEQARQELLVILGAIGSAPASMIEQQPLFAEFAAQVMEDRIEAGHLNTASSVEKWQGILEHHLLPAFGTRRIRDISHAEIVAWQRSTSKRIHAGEVKATTANGWWRTLRRIFRSAAPQLNMADPTQALSAFPEKARSYTYENPNRLTPAQAKIFLGLYREAYPQHFPMVLLMFVTGLRPCTVRPLRRRGATRDFFPDEDLVIVRRSQVKGPAGNRTKTGLDQRIVLPAFVTEVLVAHCRALDAEVGPMADSDLLFPGTNGGYRSRSALDDSLVRISNDAGLGFVITPRAFRRTFKDLARLNGITRVVERSISGHFTEEMDHVYGTALDHEQRAALLGVARLAGLGHEPARLHTACVQLAPECVRGEMTASCLEHHVRASKNG